MNLYKIGGIFAILACLGILVFSYLSWQDKLQGATGEPEAQSETVSTQSDTINTQTEPKSDGFVNDEEQLANMDEQVQKLFLSKNAAGEPIQFLIAGSAALESGDPGYAQILQSSLEEAYGDSIEVDIQAIDGTSDSLKFVELETPYDIVLLEPMTLMNNDRISIEEEREDVEDFSTRLEENNSDAVVILHPPQPIFGAGYYRAQVQALSEFAKLYGYPYIDHWNAWPATDDAALKEHLTEDAVPNSMGAQTWASELENYFIAN